MIKTLNIFTVSSLWFSRLNQEKPRIQSWHSCFCSSITSSSKVRSWYVQYQCFEGERVRLISSAFASFLWFLLISNWWFLLSKRSVCSPCIQRWVALVPTIWKIYDELVDISLAIRWLLQEKEVRTCTFPRLNSGSTSMIHSCSTRTLSL